MKQKNHILYFHGPLEKKYNIWFEKKSVQYWGFCIPCAINCWICTDNVQIRYLNVQANYRNQMAKCFLCILCIKTWFNRYLFVQSVEKNLLHREKNWRKFLTHAPMTQPHRFVCFIIVISTLSCCMYSYHCWTISGDESKFLVKNFFIEAIYARWFIKFLTAKTRNLRYCVPVRSSHEVRQIRECIYAIYWFSLL